MNKKRGQRDGHGRCVVSLSLDAADLEKLDALCERYSRYKGRTVSRSEMLRQGIHLATMLDRGERPENVFNRTL